VETLAALIAPPVVTEGDDAAAKTAEGNEDENDDEGKDEGNDDDDDDDDEEEEDEEDFNPDAEDDEDDEEERDGNPAFGAFGDAGRSYSVNSTDREGLTPLHVALLYGSIGCLKALLEAGAKAYVTLEGSPPMHIACAMSGFEKHEAFAIEAVKALLPHVENECTQDDYGRTALSVAAQHGVLPIVQHLVSEFTPPNEEDTVEVYVNLRDKTRNRPVHWACAYGRGDVVDFLLKNGADPTLKNDNKDNALHCAVRGGDVKCVELLLKSHGALTKDKNAQQQTPGELAAARGRPTIAKLLKATVLSAADEDLKRVIIAPDVCFLHHSCPPITRLPADEPPPENVNRLNVLLNNTNGTLRGKDFEDMNVEYVSDVQPAAWADVLRCHEYAYLRKVQKICEQLPDIRVIPRAIGTIDGDTAVCSQSFNAALAAAGATIEAVEKIVSGETNKVFCAVRPPGHHSGPLGPVGTPSEPIGTGSHGFCLINNVAVAAAYARCVHRKTLRRIALVDFDVHHGNGTEACVQNTAPSAPQFKYSLPIGGGTFSMNMYRPWLDETDPEEVMFASVHGYGRKELQHHFYPGTGPTKSTKGEYDLDTEEPAVWEDDGVVEDPIHVEAENRVSTARGEQPWVLDVGMEGTGKKSERGAAWRRVWKGKILPAINAFEPELIIISAGFDAHAKDDIQGPVNLGVKEQDYEWLTTELMKIANSHAKGRVISVLEGGYRIQGGPVSAFGRSVAAHVRTLFQPNAEKYDAEASKAEFNEELRVRREIREKREAEAEAERIAFLERLAEEQNEAAANVDGDADFDADASGEKRPAADSDVPAPSGKRRRGAPVDYAALNAKIEAEAAAKRAAADGTAMDHD